MFCDCVLLNILGSLPIYITFLGPLQQTTTSWWFKTKHMYYLITLISEVQNQSHWAKGEVWTGLAPALIFRGEFISLPLLLLVSSYISWLKIPSLTHSKLLLPSAHPLFLPLTSLPPSYRHLMITLDSDSPGDSPHLRIPNVFTIRVPFAGVPVMALD